MANFQLIVPDQSGKGVAVKDFAKHVDAQLKLFLDSDAGKKLEKSVIEQATAAINALKTLVSAGHAGEAHVYAVVSTGIDPSAYPAGTGQIVNLHIESRPAPAKIESDVVLSARDRVRTADVALANAQQLSPADEGAVARAKSEQDAANKALSEALKQPQLAQEIPVTAATSPSAAASARQQSPKLPQPGKPLTSAAAAETSNRAAVAADAQGATAASASASPGPSGKTGSTEALVAKDRSGAKRTAAESKPKR